jgi:type II secretory pathway pseudopilin PulG
MNVKKHNFSLLEIVIVIVLVAIVAGIAIPSFRTRTAGVVRLELQDDLNEIFANAAIRAQAFGKQVKITFTSSQDQALSCRVENEITNPELPTVSAEDESEEQYNARLENKHNLRIWGGADKHSLPEEVKISNFVDLVDENNEIVFRFYPDGEAVGPIMKLQIGDMEFHVSVDRLKGQLVMYEIERL